MRVTLLFGLLLFLSQTASADSLGFSWQENHDSDEIAIEVKDEFTGEPISDAVVRLGPYTGLIDISTAAAMRLSMPLRVKTGANGRAFFETATDWDEDETQSHLITIKKAGYVTATIAGLSSGKLTVYLHPLMTSVPENMASGATSGWRPTQLPEDLERPLAKPIQVGLVLRSLSPLDLLRFDLNSIISPINDVINIYGDREIPSNFVLPEQSIPIFVGSVRVKKLNYRLPIRGSRPMRLVIGQGTISSSDLIDIGQSGATASAVNKVKFERIGFSSILEPNTDFVQDLNGNIELTPIQKIEVQSPAFEADVLVTTLSDLDGDGRSLIPTDVKAPITVEALQSHGPKEVTLRGFPDSRNLQVLTIAVAPDQKRISGIITPSTGLIVKAGDFLGSELLTDARSLPAKITMASHTQGLQTLSFEGVLANPAIAGNRPARTYPLWTVTTVPSAGSATVIPPTSFAAPLKRYSISRTEFGQSFDETRIDGETLVPQVTRFSRSSAKIGK